MLVANVWNRELSTRKAGIHSPITCYFTLLPPRRLLNDEAMVPMHPWYRGFTGSITEIVPTRARCEAERGRSGENGG